MSHEAFKYTRGIDKDGKPFPTLLTLPYGTTLFSIYWACKNFSKPQAPHTPEAKESFQKAAQIIENYYNSHFSTDAREIDCHLKLLKGVTYTSVQPLIDHDMSDVLGAYESVVHYSCIRE